jgi:hypothetical protein
MKKLFLITLTALALAVAPATVVASESNSLFNAKELSVALGTGYVVDTAAAFEQDYTFNLTAGVGYYLTKNFGIEANVPFYQSHGASVEEVQVGLLARVPIGFVAPYVGVGGAGNWEADKTWSYIGKVGVEVRLNPKWGVFVEGQYRDIAFDGNGAITVQGGVRLVF